MEIKVIAGLGAMCLVMGIGMYLMYLSGWMVLQAKSAITFVSSGRGKAASFSGCSGYIKRVVRFPEDREYTFAMDTALTKGSVTMSLLAPDKMEVLRLDTGKLRATVALNRKKRYTLILRFQSATGKYRLQWD